MGMSGDGADWEWEKPNPRPNSFISLCTNFISILTDP